MSEERFEQDERKDEDVEAHHRRRLRSDEAPRELGDDGDGDDDDVEAHRRRSA